MEVEANKNSSKNEELGLILYFSGGKSTDTKVALRVCAHNRKIMN